MKLLISSSLLGMAAHWRNVLSVTGIHTELHNTYLSSVASDIPPQGCATQVWLVNPARKVQARVLLDRAQHPPIGPAWRYAYCGESHEPQFAQYWRCDKNRENAT